MGDTEDITVDTTDTLTEMVTTEARGLLHLKPNLKPNLKRKVPLMALMADTMDTLMDMDMVTTVKKTFLDCNILPFFNNPPLELSKPTLLPSAILLKTVFLKNCYKTHNWTQL